MKKFIAVLVVFLTIFSLTACGGGEENVPKQQTEPGVEEIFNKISTSVNLPEDILELSVTDLEDYYGITSDMFTEFKAIQNASGWQDEIVIFKATSQENASAIAALLEDRIEYSKGQMRDYSPEQYQILTKSNVIVKGLFVSMFVSTDSAQMDEIFSSHF